jgi:hypothetical protein
VEADDGDDAEGFDVAFRLARCGVERRARIEGCVDGGVDDRGGPAISISGSLFVVTTATCATDTSSSVQGMRPGMEPGVDGRDDMVSETDAISMSRSRVNGRPASMASTFGVDERDTSLSSMPSASSTLIARDSHTAVAR